MGAGQQSSVLLGFTGRVLSRWGLRPKRQNRNVLMVAQYLGLGGLERMILNLATSLKADLNWSPSVFVFDHSQFSDPSEHLGSEFEAAGIPVTYYSKGKGFSIIAVLKIAAAVFRGDVSVIHTHDLGSLIYGACGKI